MTASVLNYLRGNPDPARNYECKFSLGPLEIPAQVPVLAPNDFGFDPIALGDTDCRMAPILDLMVEEWDQMRAVNLRSVFLFSRYAFRRMRAQGTGNIISIALAAAKIGGLAASAHDSASKAGVIYLYEIPGHTNAV